MHQARVRPHFVCHFVPYFVEECTESDKVVDKVKDKVVKVDAPLGKRSARMYDRSDSSLAEKSSLLSSAGYLYAHYV